MRRVLAYARADGARLLRTRRVWAATALLALFFLPSLPAVADPQRRPVAELLLLIPLELLTFSLVVVAAVGYGALADDGSVGFRLGRGGSRRELLAGTALARVAATTLALLSVLVVAWAVVAWSYGRPYALAYWTMGAWMLAYGALWTVVAVGYGAAVRSPYRAVAALAGTFVVFSSNFGVWDVVVRPLAALVATGSAAVPGYEVLSEAPVWLQVVERLNPLVDLRLALGWTLGVVGPGTPTGNPLAHALGVGVVLLFGALALAVGLRRFERADLGGGSGSPLATRLRRALDRLGTRVAGTLGGPAGRETGPAWRTVARAHLRHAFRSRVVLVGFGLALLLAGPPVWERTATSTVSDLDRQLVRTPQRLLFPLLVLGLVVGHGAVVGERTAGTAQLVLGTGSGRRDLLRGVFTARLALVLGTGIVLLAVAWGLATVRLGRLFPGAIVAGTVWTLASALWWASVTLAASAATRTRYRSLGVILGVFLLFSTETGLWGSLVRPLAALPLTGQFRPGLVPDPGWPLWFQAVDTLNPLVAVETLREGLYAAAGYRSGAAPPTALVVYGTAVLVLTCLVSLALGIRRFDRCRLD